jgi:hypothetical protein
MTPRAPRSLDVSAGIYRVLLVVYPASFRRQHAGEMVGGRRATVGNRKEGCHVA